MGEDGGGRDADGRRREGVLTDAGNPEAFGEELQTRQKWRLFPW